MPIPIRICKRALGIFVYLAIKLKLMKFLRGIQIVITPNIWNYNFYLTDILKG
jgi:hypothetical protein